MFSVEFIFRLIGMVIVALLGWSFGGWASRIEPFVPGQELLYRLVFGLVGALAGLVLTPYVTTRPSRAFRFMPRRELSMIFSLQYSSNTASMFCVMRPSGVLSALPRVQ